MSSDGGTPEELAALQRELNLTAAAKNTRDLRHSDEPRWRRLRQRLEQEGLRDWARNPETRKALRIGVCSDKDSASGDGEN
jgi:hypothetical protein